MQELNWLAFRYVAGEHSVAEEQQFERRLAHDQSAREAVEEAVELREALQVAALDLPLVAASVPTSSARGLRFWMTGSVAGVAWMGFLVWLAGIGGIFRPANAPVTVAPSETQKQVEPSLRTDGGQLLALTWADVHNTLADKEATSELSEESLWPEAATEELHAVPEWLLTAVSKRPVSPEGNK